MAEQMIEEEVIEMQKAEIDALRGYVAKLEKGIRIRDEHIEHLNRAMRRTGLYVQEALETYRKEKFNASTTGGADVPSDNGGS